MEPTILNRPRSHQFRINRERRWIIHPHDASVRSCRATIQDLDGTSHTAEVTASSLFEAVAQGLSALHKNEWVEGIEERFGFVKVSRADVRVEHQVKIADFMKWLERPGRTPREITHRLRIRAILGMSVSR